MNNAEDVIERLCKLQSEVTEHLGYQYAADCFCGKGGFWESTDYDGTHEHGYRNDMKSIEFIEQAVRSRLSLLEKP